MADQDDVRRTALALPDTSEAADRFAFSVSNKGKQKAIEVAALEELIVDAWHCQAPRALVESFERGEP